MLNVIKNQNNVKSLNSGMAKKNLQFYIHKIHTCTLKLLLWKKEQFFKSLIPQDLQTREDLRFTHYENLK